MNWNHFVRQAHRWVSVIFTLCVIANFVAMGMSDEQPPALVVYSPLLPLLLLLLSGSYLFVLPYLGKARRAKGA